MMRLSHEKGFEFKFLLFETFIRNLIITANFLGVRLLWMDGKKKNVTLCDK